MTPSAMRLFSGVIALADLSTAQQVAHGQYMPSPDVPPVFAADRHVSAVHGCSLFCLQTTVGSVLTAVCVQNMFLTNVSPGCDVAVWGADGLQAIKKVLRVVLGKEGSRLKFDDHLILSSDCSQAEEREIEFTFQSTTGHTLHQSEAAVLAFCWNSKVFTSDCERIIFQALYRSCHPAVDVAHATNIKAEVEKLLCAVESSRYRPGCVMQQAVKACFPAQPSGDLFH